MRHDKKEGEKRDDVLFFFLFLLSFFFVAVFVGVVCFGVLKLMTEWE